MIGQIVSLFTGGKESPVGQVMDFIDELHLSEEEKLKAKQAAADRNWDAVNKRNTEQNETTKEQTKHSSIFVAGARPFIMWICGGGLGLSYIGAFVFAAIVSVCIIFDPLNVEVYKMAGDYYMTSTAPIFAHSTELLLGMLGLGTARMFEKLAGVARNSLKEIK